MTMWTREQMMAIDAKNTTILVSAAAGSGKTAVLVERIVQLIRGGAQLDRMLIVTFTKAAASEMRQRLNRRLVMEAQGNPKLFSSAVDALESTEISTIHAFCQKVLRNNFQHIGIDPLVRPCDDQLKKTLFAEAWLDAFNALLEEAADADFMELAQAWPQGQLEEMTDQLHDFMMSMANPFDWLSRQVESIGESSYEEHRWYRKLVAKSAIDVEGIGEILQSMRALFDDPDAVETRRVQYESDVAEYEKLKRIDVSDVKMLIDALAGYEFAKAKGAKTTDAQKSWIKRYDNQRNEIKKIVKDTLDALTLDEEQLQVEMGMMQRHLRGLKVLTERTHEVFLAKKAEKHVIDFNDMEQFTLQILQNEQLREQMCREYDHIFVDECQDVSQVQDAILQSLHDEKNVMFMVGDVKQSIYRFRKADPTLFMGRLRTFSDDEDAKERRIILQKNFRSRFNVLEATNQVFRAVMRPGVTELDYEKKDELICGRASEDDPAVEVHLLDMANQTDEEDIDKLEAEANVVIRRVRELLNETYDSAGKQVHYQYRDMVILLSAAANTAPKLVELLGQAGIPVFYDGAAAFFELPEVQSMKALLSVIDNPMQDVPLMAALKMAPFSLLDEELARIRTAKTGKDVPLFEAFEAICAADEALSQRCAAIMRQFEDWRFACETMRLSDFVWQVMQSSGYYASVGALPGGELRQANLRMLFQRAQDFENNVGGTLTDFLMLCDQQGAADDKMSAKTLGENENLLRIMTMHKSKGLEFPVVFCMQLGGQLIKPFRGELMMHPSLGVAMPYVNREMRTKRKVALASEAFRFQRELDDRAERSRLLYVAMTRARERLILIGCPKEKSRDVWRMPVSNYAVWRASSMLDWVMQGALNDKKRDIHKISTKYPQDAKPWNISDCDDIRALDVDNAVDKPDMDAYLMDVLARPMGETVQAWDEPEQAAPNAPIKTSVSAIARKAVFQDSMPITDAEEDVDEKRAAEDIINPLRMSELPSRPAFMEEKRMTGAERGTLTHRTLSIMPIAEVPKNIDVWVNLSVQEMAERGVFTYQEVLVLDHAGISAYFRSELGQRMLRSERVRREWAFNLVMDESGTLLQGVIDCAFLEDGEWVLVDYKTDRIADEAAFIERYRLQLTWYARALATITGLPVKEAWLYAIGKRRAYRVETMQ